MKERDYQPDRTLEIMFQKLSALLMLVSGVALSVAGFVVDPVGEISDSVLWYVAQALIYAGSVFGVTVYIDQRLGQLKGFVKN